MYQNRGGITGLRCLREAKNCTTQRPPNISAPVSPISFHGDMCTPVHSSHVMALFMKSVAGIIYGLRVRGVAARKKRGRQERSGKARAGLQERRRRNAAGAHSTSSTAGKVGRSPAGTTVPNTHLVRRLKTKKKA